MNEQDKQVQALFDIVQKKKSDIAKAERPSWETTCTFHKDPGSSASQNIQTITKLDELVSIMAFLMEKEFFFESANKELGTKVKFNWQGYTIDQWRSDIKTRINKVEITKKKKELEDLESRLNTIISPEVRRKMEIDAIAAELGKE
jgi:hypothetical protein